MRTVSVWQADAVRAPRTGGAARGADVAIVGGGVVGAATAWALRRRRPGLRVVLLEAEVLAHGASGRNAGFLLPGVHTDYATAVAAYGRVRARRLWGVTIEGVHAAYRFGPEAAATRTGSLLAAGTRAEAERFARAAAWMQEDGFACRLLDARDTNERVRAIGFRAGLLLPDGGVVHPVRLVRALAEASEADVREDWRVTALAPTTSGLRLEGPRGVVEAGAVVLALNAALPRLWPEAERFVRPVRAQMAVTGSVPPVLPLPVYSHEGYYYVRQREDGRVLVGGARHRHAEREVGYEDAVTAPLQADLLRYLRRHFPLLAGAEVERRWAGTMGFSPDGLPVWGAVTGSPGAFFACGFTGHGMAYALRFGELLARAVLGETDEAADLFAVDRLALGGSPTVGLSA